MIRHCSVLISFLLVLSACATPQQKAQWEFEASRPVTCSQGSDCEVKWSRALIWVQDHSRWKLRIANDTLITTEGPFDTTDAAYSITKVPTGTGTYTIVFRAGCGNMFGCVPSILELQASFVNFVMGSIKPLPAVIQKDATTEKIKPPPAIIQKDATTEKLKFGVRMAKTNLAAANILGMKEPKGVIIVSVVQDSVAFGAGLVQGDAILKYGEKIVNDVSDLQAAIAATAPGSTIPLTIWRAGRGEMVITAQFHQ